MYLLISGLYAPDSQQAAWILDDFQDNLYMNPPFGYNDDLPERTWFDRGGVSIQPNLLAGLMPHLDRDEIEVYLGCSATAGTLRYREEITAMVEHPYPVLGFLEQRALQDLGRGQRYGRGCSTCSSMPPPRSCTSARPSRAIGCGPGAVPVSRACRPRYGSVDSAYAPHADRAIASRPR